MPDKRRQERLERLLELGFPKKFLGLKLPIGKPCECDLCQRGRKFENIIKKSQLSKEDKIWVMSIYDLLMNEQEELAMYKAAYDELYEKQNKTTNPKTTNIPDKVSKA